MIVNSDTHLDTAIFIHRGRGQLLFSWMMTRSGLIKTLDPEQASYSYLSAEIESTSGA